MMIKLGGSIAITWSWRVVEGMTGRERRRENIDWKGD